MYINYSYNCKILNLPSLMFVKICNYRFLMQLSQARKNIKLKIDVTKNILITYFLE